MDEATPCRAASGESAELTGIGDDWNLPAGKFGSLRSLHSTSSGTAISGFLYTALDKSTMEFDASGRLTKIADSAGDTISLTYQTKSGAENVLATATYSMRDGSNQRKITFIADGTGRHIRTITDDTQRSWTVETTSAGNRTYLKTWRLDSDGATTGTSPSSVTTAGKRYDNVYECFSGSLRGGLLKTITRKIGDGIAGTQTYTYYANGRTLSTTNSLGATEYLSYDTFVSDELNYGVNARPSVGTTRSYHTDFNGNVSTTLFDRYGNVVTVTNPDGSRQTSTWIQYRYTLDANSDDDGRWLPFTRTDVDGLSTIYVYPTKNIGGKPFVKSAANGLPETGITGSSANPAAAVTPSTDGPATNYSYDKTFLDKTTVTAAGNRKTQNIYDGVTGLLTRTDVQFNSIGSDGQPRAQTASTRSFYITTAGVKTPLLDYVIQPGGKKIVYTYDSSKQLRTQVDQDGQLAEFFIYDRRGDLAQNFKYRASYMNESDALSHSLERKQFVYDSLGRLRETWIDFNVEKTYVTGQSPSENHLSEKVTSRYDEFGRVIESRASHGRTTSTSYDLDGNAYLTTAYDNTGFNDFMSMPLAAFPARAQRQTAVLFDDRQRPYAVRDAAGDVSLTQYDAAGEVSANHDSRATAGTFTLALSGTTATVLVNDVANATATVSTAKAAASAATTWGLVYKTSTPIGSSKVIDAWDGWRFNITPRLTRFAYTGADFDPETGLYHMGARDYDPATGRFLQQDPAEEGRRFGC